MRDEQIIRFVQTVLSLARRKATGVFEVTDEGRKVRLSFLRGRLVFAEHKSLGSTLGAYVVTRGLLKRAQYERIAEQIRGKPHRSPMLAFVELAVAHGLLEPEQANTLLQGQVERNFVELLGWDHFECSFLADDEVEQGPRFPCELEALVLQGLRQVDTDVLRRQLQSRLNYYPKVRTAPSDLVRLFRLQPAELRVVRAANGERSTTELLDNPALDTHATAAVLVGLKLSQQLEWAMNPGEEGDPSDSSPTHAVPIGVVKVRKEAAPPSVRLTLPLPPSATEIEAASAFRQGIALYKQGDLARAHAQFASAIAEVDHPEYVLYATWVEHEMAGRPRDASSFMRLADAARRALERDPTIAFGYFVVGHLHLMQNDPLNAELAFRRAAKLDPTDARAETEAERLRVARQSRPSPT